MRYFLIILLLSFDLLADTNKTSQDTAFFEAIQVEGQDENSPFAMPNYLESQTYLPDAPGQSRLTSKEAMHLPGVQGDPVKAIKLLAGVTSTGSSGELVVHASKPRETLSTINQLPIGYLFHMGGLHSVIAPGAIEQLDIYLGGFDATYNNAMGGVLDITPKYPMGDNAGFVHVGIFDASFGLDAKITDDLSLYIGARRSYFDLFIGEFAAKEGDDDTNVSVTITQFPRYYDSTTLLSYTKDNHQISVENILARDEIALVIDGNVQDPTANGNIDSKQGFTSTGLRWQYNNYDNYQSNTLLYYLNTFANIELFTDFKVIVETNELGLKHLSTYKTDRHKFSFGAYAQSYTVPLDVYSPARPTPEDINTTLTDPITVNETIKTDVLTLLAQDVYKVNDDFTMRYGFNFVTSTRKNMQNIIDPRASLIYKTSLQDTLALSVGQYSQTPEGSRLISQGGNPNLSFENSKHYTLKYAHKFKDAHLIEIEPYYKSFEKLAISDTLENKNYVSTGKGDALGLDITYKLRTENFYLLTTYTYTQAQRQINNETNNLYTFYGEIPHTLNVVGSYKINDRWNISTLFKFQSGRPYTPVIGVDDSNLSYIKPVWGEPFSERLNDYISLNLKAQYTKKYSKSSRIEYSFELMNITNNVNEVGISYSDDYSKEIRRADLPFLPWFDISYYF